MKTTIRFLVMAAAVFAAAGAGAEVITLRSGQVGGFPGAPGQPDDIMTFGASVTTGPLSTNPFTAADFNATTANTAWLVAPFGWLGGLTFDPSARWVGVPSPDGTPFGAPASTIYRVPFTVTTSGITSASLSIAWATADTLGDLIPGGANPIGGYLRDPGGNITPLTLVAGGNSTTESTAFGINVTTAINTGLNELFLYQRQFTDPHCGLIFGAHIDIVPAPGSLALLGMGGFVAARRRR